MFALVVFQLVEQSTGFPAEIVDVAKLCLDAAVQQGGDRRLQDGLSLASIEHCHRDRRILARRGSQVFDRHMASGLQCVLHPGCQRDSVQGTNVEIELRQSGAPHRLLHLRVVA